MALLTISGEPGSQWEEVARAVAQLLRLELVTEENALKAAILSILEHHLVVAVPGAESLFQDVPMLRVGIGRIDGKFDLVLSTEFSAAQAAEIVRAAWQATERGPVKRVSFGHPSEQMFANLLDFYRIAWEYEPRSFPLQWDKDGKVVEAFTPDFYLPELDLYVEVTAMKQALVTKKNRKIKLLRAIYPHVNIQVFYKKDFQDLVFKHAH
jgi:hypothetical protein